MARITKEGTNIEFNQVRGMIRKEIIERYGGISKFLHSEKGEELGGMKMKINISEFINDCELSKGEIIKYLGISRSTFYALYKGEATSIQFETLQKLCVLFHCTPNDLFTDYSKSKKDNSQLPKEEFAKDAHVSFGEIIDEVFSERVKALIKEYNEKDDTK